MVDFYRPVHCILGLPFDALNAQQALRRLEEARAGGPRCFLSTPNLNFLVASQRDPAFRDSVCRSDLSVADGMPLVWLARLLGLPLPERVSGSGLFELLRRRSGLPWDVFFFGGQPDAGRLACEALGGQPSSMRAAGHLCPGFGSVEQMSPPEWIERINASGAHLVVVSLGSAKGQAWISRNLDQLHAPVISHLGAVVNFVAGTVARAPRWMQRTGLEWLWRVKEEPQLWQRYARDGLALLRLLATRVAPLVMLQQLQAPPEQAYRQARVTRPRTTDKACASLQGAWRDDNLLPVRQAFTQLLAMGGDVTLDLADTTWVGSSLAGLLALLDTALRDRGDRLRLTQVPPRIRRLLYLHGALPEGAL